jgi:hypothetical protein
MTLTWKHALIAISVVTMTLGAAGCKKADTPTTDTAAASSAPAAADSTVGASGAVAASGASQ